MLKRKIMSLEEMVDVIRFMVADKLPEKKLKIEELNSIFKMVEYDLMSDLYGTSLSEKGYETSGQISDALIPFKTVQAVYLIAGLGTLPDNYLHWGRCHYINGSDKIPIELVTTQELEQRLYNSVTSPTLRHPVVELSNIDHIQIYPTTVTSPAYMTYIKKPTPASYVLKIENGIQVYDSALSVQPQWRDAQHIDYIRHILKYLGLVMDNLGIVQYVEQKQAQGN